GARLFRAANPRRWLLRRSLSGDSHSAAGLGGSAGKWSILRTMESAMRDLLIQIGSFGFLALVGGVLTMAIRRRIRGPIIPPQRQRATPPVLARIGIAVLAMIYVMSTAAIISQPALDSLPFALGASVVAGSSNVALCGAPQPAAPVLNAAAVWQQH